MWPKGWAIRLAEANKRIAQIIKTPGYKAMSLPRVHPKQNSLLNSIPGSFGAEGN